MFDLFYTLIPDLIGQSGAGLVPTGWLEAEICAEGDDLLYSSAFHAVTAAFATLGYYMQASLIHFIINSTFGHFAALMYILAFVAGGISMAMGQPPKNYVWFFIGPAVYMWLIDNPVESNGVRWMIGNVGQDQSEVWRHAQLGLINSNWARSTAGLEVSLEDGPSIPATVAMPFVWFDSLMSSTVRYLVDWSGVHNHNPHRTRWGSYLEDAGEAWTDELFCQGSIPGHPESSSNLEAVGRANYSVVSHLKWGQYHNISNARLSNVELRDAFARFMSSECGEVLGQSLSQAALASASQAKGSDIPWTVFKQLDSDSCVHGVGCDYTLAKKNLADQIVPIPRSIRNLFSGRERFGGHFYDFRSAVDWGPDDEVLRGMLRTDRLSCATYLDLLVLMFRHESGVIFARSFGQDLPAGWDSYHIVYNMLYGWDVPSRTLTEEDPPVPLSGSTLTLSDQERFIQDMILVYLFRNELSMVPRLHTVSKSGAQHVVENLELHQRSLGAIHKFAEVYTWALMIPYLQGILLYFLAMIYPIACMLIVVPGWHKFLFTWISFWAWARLWDLGFAIVATLERSVWAMLGNTSASAATNQRIVQMQEFGSAGWLNDCYPSIQNCLIPKVVVSSAAPAGSWAETPLVVSDSATHEANLRLFDLSLSVGANLNLDLANSYYIYIMAALYFAVPAVTGQLVLGAKAGAASMVGQFTGSATQHGSQGAQTGFQGQMTQAQMSNKETIGQSATAAAHRKSGLAHQALGMQNTAQDFALASSQAGDLREGANDYGNARVLAIDSNTKQGEIAFWGAKQLVTGGTGSNQKQGGAGGGASTTRRESGVEGGGTRGGGTDSGGTGSGIGNPTSTDVARGTPGGFRSEALENQHTAGNMASAAGFMFGGGNAGGNWNLMGNAANLLEGTQVAYAAGQERRKSDANNLSRAQAANHRLNSSAAGLHSKAYQEGGSRLMSYAQGQAQMGEFEKLNKFANENAAQFAIYGGQPGSLGSQIAKDANWMAYAGMLDSSQNNTQAQARYFEPGQSGGFSAKVDSTYAQLHQDVGSDAIRGIYEQNLNSPMQEGARAGADAGRALQSFVNVDPANRYSDGVK